MDTKKNHLGRNSLIISITGLIVVELLIYYGFLKSGYWQILLSGFEAATIGGFADWFAVRALFHEIPIPFVRRHTDIVVRNRKKLTEGVVDLVTNKWLSPEVIKEKIADFSFLEGLIKTLREPHNTDKLIGFLKEITRRLVSNADDPEVTKILQSLIKDQLIYFDISTPLGKWMKKSIENDDHNALWEIVLEAAGKTVNDDTTRVTLLKLVAKQMEEYKSEGFFKSLLLGIGGGVGAIDNESIVDKIINSLDDLVREAKGNPNHSLRTKFDSNIMEFANGLIEGEEESTKVTKDLQEKLLHNVDSNKIFHNIFIKLKESVIQLLDEDDSPYTTFLNHHIDKLLTELETDKSSQKKIEFWIKDAIGNLISKYHPEIGEIVRFSLTRLNDDELVNQIEEKVGNDLQYIRLNGSVVGGFVGLVIAMLRMLLT